MLVVRLTKKTQASADCYSTLSGKLGVVFVPIVGAIGGSSRIFNQTLKGSFRNGLLFGSGSITSLYADWNAKVTALSGRFDGQLDIFGLQIESGLSGELGSIGGRLGIGLRPTNDGKMELYFGSGLALGVGWDFYIRIRFDKLF